MHHAMSQAEPPFPTEGIIPEHRQIGRRNAILGLERRLREPHHRAIIDERRVGKSSVAYAALQRLDEDPRIVTLTVDLRAIGAHQEADLVTALRAAARGAGVAHDASLKRTIGTLRGALSGKGETLVADISRLVSRAAGVGEIADAAGAATSLAGVLGGDELPDIAAQLQALEAWGLVHDQTIIIFIDEVQELAGWQDGATVAGLARAMRSPLQQVRLLFAGSETRAMRDLFSGGQPLADHALDFDLAEIAPEDWLHELPTRFAEAGFTVEDTALMAALEASPGQPLRTNQICQQAVEGAPDYGFADHVTVDVMQYAISVVKRRDPPTDDG
jgi:hypothetical protein